MKTIKPLIIVASLLLAQTSFASENHEEGEKLYKANCSACHGSTGGMDMTKRLAPPIAAVRMHYIDIYPDQTSFVNAVTSWVEKQDENKSHMRGAIQKFKIMPPLSVAKDDAAKIAAYIYSGDIEKLEGFEEHVKEEHGKMGMGKMHKGMGKGMKHEEGMHNKGMGKGMMHGEGMHKEMMGGKGKMQGKGMHKGMMGMTKMHSENMRKDMKKMQGKRSAMKNIMKQLNITPEQRARIQPLMMEKKTVMMPLRQQMKQIKKNIAALDTANQNYKASIFALAEQQAGLVHRMVIEKGEMRMKLNSVLTPEQRNKLKSLKQSHKGSKGMKHKMMNMQ